MLPKNMDGFIDDFEAELLVSDTNFKIPKDKELDDDYISVLTNCPTRIQPLFCSQSGGAALIHLPCSTLQINCNFYFVLFIFACLLPICTFIYQPSISTEGALRRPMTYYNHQSHPSDI